MSHLAPRCEDLDAVPGCRECAERDLFRKPILRHTPTIQQASAGLRRGNDIRAVVPPLRKVAELWQWSMDLWEEWIISHGRANNASLWFARSLIQ